jgi:hypothetical protein
MSTILETALVYASLNLEVFPVPPGTKKSYKSKAYSAEGKRWGATKNPDTINSYWAEHPDANIGIPCGKENGFWVLEYDTVSGHGVDGAASLAALEAEFGPMPATRQAESPSGSVHFYFQHPGSDIVGTTGIRPGIDIRGDGNMVIAPPSVKPGVGAYRWLNDLPAADAPTWLLDLVKTATASAAAIERAPVNIPPPPPGASTAETALHTEYHRVAQAPEGKRNYQLNKSSFELGRFVGASELDEEKAIQNLVNACEANGSFAEDAGECQATIDSGMRAGKADPVQTVSTMFGGHVSGAKGMTSRVGSPPLAPDGPLPEHPNLTAHQAVALEDFYGYLPAHTYIFTPTGEMWPASSVNSRVSPVSIPMREKPIPAASWLDKNRAVEQMTWAPGKPMVIADKLIADGGWFDRPGCKTFNLYRPPTIKPQAGDATPWIDHVKFVFGDDDARHIIKWFAHRVQHPDQKVNHALVFGGMQGVGKDTLIEPVKQAVGPWNFAEVSPQQMLGRVNPFVKSVILRVSEARDLGDTDRFGFYEHTKAYTAAPPDVLRVDEMHMREHAVLNVCGVIITTNNKDSLHLPADDRRHFVAWSNRKKEDFPPDYWTAIYRWFANGGIEMVAHYLATLDISGFDPKAPPPKTPAFWEIVDSSRSPEDAEMADALDRLDPRQQSPLAQLSRERRRTSPTICATAGTGVRYPIAWTNADMSRCETPAKTAFGLSRANVKPYTRSENFPCVTGLRRQND